jgi:hypothetical protein
MAYLTNNERLDLGLIGQSDRPVADIQAALAKAPAGYYVEGVAVAGPPKGGPGGGGGAPGAPGPSGEAGGTDPGSTKRMRK